MQITATYSPEDNKIRLYASARLDAETYAKVKEAGFRWAPKQELFVAPKWTCAREDLAIELAGEIEAEEMTLAERAQAKADRLEELANKRASDAKGFAKAARDISERFAYGQPILVGHHSERKARKDQERMHNAERNAHKAADLSSYWMYRARGVECHANYKNDPKVRANRIKTLLAELRDLQRDINSAHKRLELWQSCKTDAQIKLLLGRGITSYNLYSKVESGEIEPQKAREMAIAAATRTVESQAYARTIAHILNRLDYERELLGPVPIFEGELTPVILQQFVREHGGDKPKGERIDADTLSITCDAPLPAHIGDGCDIALSETEWRDLMQSCGYLPPVKKAAKPPILNFDSPTGSVSVVNPWRREEEILQQVTVTKAEYAKIHSEQRGTRLSTCGGFRVRICPNPKHEGPRYMAGWVAIVLSDQKKHDVPASVIDLAEATKGDAAA